jgi:uncharacterized membrane protein YqgA involved in biofilm formation
LRGTLVNAAAVIVGSTLGFLLSRRIPGSLKTAAFDAIGLFTLALGFTMASRTGNFLIPVLSVVSGSLIGTALNLERRLERLGERLKTRLGSTESSFTEGLIAAFMLFCMGSMTVLGAVEEGLGGRPDLLYSKSVLDGVASVALASAMGLGVIFAVIPLVMYQGGLTVLAGLVGSGMPEKAVTEVSAAGGIILLGLGLRILDLGRKIRVLDMLPALVVAALLACFVF